MHDDGTARFYANAKPRSAPPGGPVGLGRRDSRDVATMPGPETMCEGVGEAASGLEMRLWTMTMKTTTSAMRAESRIETIRARKLLRRQKDWCVRAHRRAHLRSSRAKRQIASSPMPASSRDGEACLPRKPAALSGSSRPSPINRNAPTIHSSGPGASGRSRSGCTDKQSHTRTVSRHADAGRPSTMGVR